MLGLVLSSDRCLLGCMALTLLGALLYSWIKGGSQRKIDQMIFQRSPAVSIMSPRLSI